MPGGIYLKFEVDGQSLKRLNGALKALAADDAPYLKGAMEDIGRRLVSEARGYAVGGIAGSLQFKGLSKSKLNVKALGLAAHPGAKSQEFGRSYYYRGFKRGGKGSQKSGTKFKSSPGQAAKPFVGVKTGGQAMAATRGFARTRLAEAIDAEWNRLGEGD